MLPLSYALGGILLAHISTFSLTSAPTTIDIRFVWHPVSAHLDNFPDMCAEKPHPALWEASPLHTSPKMLGKSRTEQMHDHFDG